MELRPYLDHWVVCRQVISNFCFLEFFCNNFNFSTCTWCADEISISNLQDFSWLLTDTNVSWSSPSLVSAARQLLLDIQVYYPR